MPFVVNVHLKSVAQSRNVPRDILAEVAKFGGHSLNGFEVIQIFIEGRGVEKNPADLNNLLNHF